MNAPLAPQAPLSLVFTQAGIAALINAKKDGLSGVRVAQIALTDQAFVPVDTLNGLPHPLKQVSTIAGGATSPTSLHVQIRDESADTYALYGFGLILDTGVLLATYGQATPLMTKAGEAVAMLAIDIALAAGLAAQITLGDTNFQVPAATTVTPGIVRLATATEARAGTVADAAITPRTLLTTRFAPGQILYMAGTKAPAGTLVCDGRSLAIADYPDLYDAIGTLYGSEDEDSFNIPAIVEGTVSLDTADPAKVGTFFAGATVSHTHTATAAPAGAHVHNTAMKAAGDHVHGASASASGDHTHWAGTDQQGNHAHGGSTVGRSTDHSHIMGFQTVQAKYGTDINLNAVGNFNGTSAGATGGESADHTHAFATAAAGVHGHNITVNGGGNHAHTVSIAAGGSHLHPLTEDKAADHTHAVTLTSTGGDKNLPAGVYRLACIAY